VAFSVKRPTLSIEFKSNRRKINEYKFERANGNPRRLSAGQRRAAVERTWHQAPGAIALALPAIIRARADTPLAKRQELNMEIRRSGSQPSTKGPADWFSGAVRIDPLFEAPEPARALGASVTFEPFFSLSDH